MRGTMMQFPLTLCHLVRRAERLFPGSEIVTRLPDESLHRRSYGDFCRRVRRLGAALQTLGMQPGDRIATLMWNDYAHVEAYFGVPCAGGVVHTLNIRLHPDDLIYIVRHAGDRFLIVDDVLLPLYEKIRHGVSFERVIVVPLAGARVTEPFHDYEALLRSASPLVLVDPDENDAAGMCYTSGTTGRPKGVVYTHRSLVLHSLANSTVDYLGLGNNDTVCPVVPMFHVNAWGLPYTTVMMGAKLVLPGPHLDPESLLDLYERERVTVTAGVPSVWHGILQALQNEPKRWRLAEGLRMVVGGAAPPESMIRGFDDLGLQVVHGWGMTETSPVGAVNYTKREIGALSRDERCALRTKQGVPLPFFEVRAIGAAGEVPWDGASLGELQVRGPWVAEGYYELADQADKWTVDGWFRTGDIVAIDASGYVRIADRSK
ncbi:MAG TPA: AMP-binding protein, partial [Burkholderiales bacterium]|nr:AMP-binding protein [Burkholderiales bacterium]